MKIALAQMQMSQHIEENYAKSLRLIGAAAEQGADLICFPEIQLTPFFPQYEKRDVSEYLMSADSRYVKGICEKCRECGIYAAPNLYMEENGRRFDMSLLIDRQGAVLGKQKMVHIAQCDQFYEQDYYAPSDDGFQVFDTALGKIGIVVCFDRHYPESIRTEALRGAELILIPTANTTAEPAEMFRWEIRVQAFQNSVCIAMCNRVGAEGDMVFSGESVVCDHNGGEVAAAGHAETLLFAEIDPGRAAVARAEKPYTALRVPAFYES